MADEYIRKQDAANVVANTAKIVASFNYQYTIDVLLALTPADVVPVSAYKQVMLERDTVVEQLKQIGKDIREVMDDVVHLQRLLSADVAQIRHSRWIKTEDGAECEKCGREAVYQIVDDHWEYEPFCPHCGAIMDNKRENKND